ncbi:MAG: hypothetical protein HGA96_12735 [Desulfobulbaceae bacterium]|nr:hypothetical protein [Desulfobulbaceae bacterium]
MLQLQRISATPMPSLLLALVSLLLSITMAPSAALTEPLLLHDIVIDKDTTWSGDICIDGVVVVSRKVTLKISPGTKISFTNRDRNGDGIGDGELRVLGAIVAAGTKKSPIIFDSAEKNPAPKDWSYLLIFTSPAINHLSWCEFHHAFSGLQVHFSTLIVENCKFSNNNEGLRFGRADLTIKNNSFSANDIGIRFTRMEGPVRIIANNITDNRIGLFLVPSGQNIRDFFEPDRSGTPWNTGHLQISGNNILNNSWYNLNLGEKQIWDLDISNNYWGSSNQNVISSTIFDRSRDGSLGQALLEPLATTPFSTPFSPDTDTSVTSQ